MKILSITAQKPSSTGSGVYLSELLRCWQAAGHSQSVVYGCAPTDPAPDFPGVRCYPVCYESEALPFPVLGMSDEMPYPSTRYRDLTEEQFRQFAIAFHTAIAAAIDREKPDWIVCHHLYLLTALVRMWFPGQRIAGISHGSDLRQMGKNPNFRLYAIRGIRKLDRIIALHAGQQAEICRVYGCSCAKVRVIGAGYNVQIFRLPESFPVKRPRRIAYAGKLTEKKGVFSLIRALNQLPGDPVPVSMAGGFSSPEEEAEIRALAAGCRHPIEFPGILPHRELAALFQTSDLFVLPSFYEGLPLVTMEAMACGCKVVCSELPGLRPWFDAHLPGHTCTFVPMPAMKDVDEPDQTQLPAFELRLARAMYTALQSPVTAPPDLSGVSWEGVSRRILHFLDE